MFDVIKGKLTAAESKVRAVIGQATSEAAAAESRVRQLGEGVPLPLDAVTATVGQAKGAISLLIAPVRQRLASLAPPGS